MKAKKGLWVLLLVIVLAVFAVSAYKVVSHLLDRGASRRFQEELIDQMVTVVSDAPASDAQTAQPALSQGEAVSSHVSEESGMGEKASSQSGEMPLQQASVQNGEVQAAPVQTPAEGVFEADSALSFTEPVQQAMQTAQNTQILPSETEAPEVNPGAVILDEQPGEAAPAETAARVPTAEEAQQNPYSTALPAGEIAPSATPVITAAPGTTPAPTAESTVTPAPTPSETAPIAVDFDKLTSKYPNVVCWIYLPDSPVNYAVAQGEDNTQYLRSLLGGGYSYSGSIFMDHLNTPDFSDWNTILYGHNMKNGSMFGYIPYYAVQAYYDQHPYLYILTPDQDYKVDLFAGYVTTPDSDAYLIAQTMEERDDIIAEAKKMTTFQADVEIGPEDRIVTLSTCTYAYDNARYVLLGVLRPLAQHVE